MRIQRTYNSAFTLVEILIVISIIAILATLSISNYNDVRSRIENQFTVDTLIQEFRSQSKLSQNQNNPTCYNIHINLEDNTIKKSNSPFLPNTRSCQSNQESNSINLLNNSQLKIVSVTEDNIEKKTETITFIPPSGLPQNPTNKNNLKIQLNTEAEPETLNTILINLHNGSIQKL